MLLRGSHYADADLMKERHDEIPENAKEIMRDLGIDPESWEY